MTRVRAHRPTALGGLLAAAALAGCTTYHDYRYTDYGGGRYGLRGLGGTGVSQLDPWLAGTPEGQRLVLARFDHNANGQIGGDRAREANRWFRRFADRNRDHRLTDREIELGLGRVGRELGLR